MKFRIIAMILVSFYVTSCSQGMYQNNRGVLEIYFNDMDAAKQSMQKSLSYEPELWEPRYNLALINMTDDQLLKAFKELDYLEEQTKEWQPSARKEEFLYHIYFAKAFVKALLKEVPQSLELYQEALEYRPDSKKVKKNIELMMMAQSGKKGPKSKDDKSNKNSKKGQQDESDKSDQGDEGDEDKGQGQNDQEIKGQDDESLKRKELSKKEINQILKEIKKQESKIRSKENTKFKGEGASGKTW